MKYRADIDGMRAVAVIAVLVFHLEFGRFAGGFVGVDVFFVISGFLITSLIWSRASEGGFGFGEFYLRRIRRLVPPLIATVALTAVAAAVVMFPDDLSAFARSAVAALASVSNVLFFAEAGYWDTSGDLKPLLHTWSLGVEEQFYLVWPAVVVGVAALHRRIAASTLLAVITVVSFVVAIWFHSVDPSAAFYLFPFRIFQFSIGALVGFIPSSLTKRWLHAGWIRDVGAVTGLGMILWSVLTLSGEKPFPGWNAVPPTAGAALLLVAGLGERGALGRVLLENRLAVWVGRVSYSLYLVHWPIISLFRYRSGLDLTGREQAGLAVASLVGATVLHYAVERRFYSRHTEKTSRRAVLSPGRFALRAASISVALVLLMMHVIVDDGWSWRFPGLELDPTAIEEGMANRFRLTGAGCDLRSLSDGERCKMDRPVQVLVVGNSHEPDGFNFVSGGYGSNPDLNLIRFGTTNNCEAIELDGTRFVSEVEDCQARLDQMFALEELDWVVYAANRPFNPNKQMLLDLIRGLLNRYPDARLVTIGGYLNTATPCARLINETGTSRSCAAPENVDYFERDPSQGALFEEFSAITEVFVDRVDLLCLDRRLATCATETASGVPMMYDRHHLSFEFAVESGSAYARLHPDLFSASSSVSGVRR